MLVIDVRDQGIGIAHDHLARIFERFYRVEKARSRERGGTGLGLAIVKHIAQVHGGQVSVTSTVGQGSTFTLHIPRDVKCGGIVVKTAGDLLQRGTAHGLEDTGDLLRPAHPRANGGTSSPKSLYVASAGICAMP
jgi:DNA topoisomerase VI subunit B